MPAIYPQILVKTQKTKKPPTSANCKNGMSLAVFSCRLVLWPVLVRGGELTAFLPWLTHTHTQRWHAHYHSAGTGHLYQGRFRAFPIEEDDHLLTVLRYVERNPLRAGLVQRAQDWPWSSAAPARPGTPALDAGPVPRPAGWLEHVDV